MSRNILMLVPALAFALPFVAAQPTMARPLATQAPETLWDDDDDDRDDDDDDDDHDNDDDTIEITVCFAVQIAVQNDDDRSVSCDMFEGPACLSNCTAEAVAPLCLSELGDRARAHDLAACQEQRVETCRSQCESGGAAFCSLSDGLSDGLKARHDDDDDDDDDDDHDNDDDVVFIDIEQCVDLEIDLDNL